MRWPHALLMLASLVLVPGLLAVQSWAGKRRLALQQAETARYQAESERWRARQAVRPDLAGPPPQMPYTSVVALPWFSALLPLGLAPAWLATAVAAKRLQKLQHCEEEEQTPYTVEELMENWEFKIIRSPFALFDDPVFLAAVLREEALAGWRLVEKFDGTRVRLKRPAGGTPVLPDGYDPYCTPVGPTSMFHVLLGMLCCACLGLIPVFVLIQASDPIPAMALGALLVGCFGCAVAFGRGAARLRAKYRRQAKRV